MNRQPNAPPAYNYNWMDQYTRILTQNIGLIESEITKLQNGLLPLGKIDLGDQVAGLSPYIDFHSSAVVATNDYDVRIQSTGGSASDGDGTLTIYATGGLILSDGPLSVGGVTIAVTAGGVITSTNLAASNTGLGVLTGTAISAGGTTGIGIRLSSATNFGIFFGSGAPTLSAGKGSLYLRSDGTTTNDRAYINTDAGTTWTAITTVA